MDNSGLLFIPDISGFTKFVNETEIEHSRYIIGELLQNIINSNEMGLTIPRLKATPFYFIAMEKFLLLKKFTSRWKVCFVIFKNN